MIRQFHEGASNPFSGSSASTRLTGVSPWKPEFVAIVMSTERSGWREDSRRAANGEQARTIAHPAMKRGLSVDFSGYWQRHEAHVA
jgi:hypothetical protein